jgi:uncharacterized protein (TIGR02172 family)
VDTGNASAVETALLDAYEQHGALSLDANELEYVSSAGLRVFLKLRKKQGRLEVFNVSPEVWDIFDVTGFSDLLEVRKQFRQISVEGCELIGKGGNGSVYRISDDEIIKVYTAKTPLSSIEGERERARSAFVAGVPTAIPYDVVKVGDSYGIIFEMVKADVIARKFMNEPEHYDEYAQKYANLFKEIHSVSLAGKGLPATSTLYLADIDRMADWYDEKELERLRWFVRQIPQRDTMVHGDFHTNNVMVQGDELLIIDMAEISCGHPIFDLMSMYLTAGCHQGELFQSCTVEEADHIWKLFLSAYLDTEDAAILAKAEEQVAAFSCARFMLGLLRIPDLLKPEEIVRYKAKFCELYDKGIEPLCF